MGHTARSLRAAPCWPHVAGVFADQSLASIGLNRRHPAARHWAGTDVLNSPSRGAVK